MNTKLDPIFRNAAFPVLAVDESGKVLDKNPAASKHLPAIRRGCDIRRRLKNNPILTKGISVTLRDTSPFYRAIVLKGEDCLHLLFLGRLQFPDGDRIAYEIARSTGGILPLTKERTAEAVGKSPRLYREFLRVGTPEDRGIAEGVPFDRLWNELASHIGGRFRALGYRVSMERVLPVPAERLVSLSPCDLTYLIGTLLLILMNHSENGILTLKAPCNGEDTARRLLFTTRTSLSQKAIEGMKTEAALARLAPEYTAELALLPYAREHLNALRLYVDTYGKLCIEYTLPYSDIPTSLSLRSTGRPTLRNAARPLYAFLWTMAKQR